MSVNPLDLEVLPRLHSLSLSSRLQKKTIWGLGSWAGTKKESLLSRRIRHAKIVLPVHETLPLLPALVLWKPVEAIVLAAPVSQRIFPRTTGIEKQKTLVSCV